jgi:hypothetical protein
LDEYVGCAEKIQEFRFVVCFLDVELDGTLASRDINIGVRKIR